MRKNGKKKLQKIIAKMDKFIEELKKENTELKNLLKMHPMERMEYEILLDKANNELSDYERKELQRKLDSPEENWLLTIPKPATFGWVRGLESYHHSIQWKTLIDDNNETDEQKTKGVES